MIEINITMNISIKPYTYLVIHKSTGYFYYGVRLSNKLPAKQDLSILYYTSSGTVKSIIEAEGIDSFEWIIRKEFDNKKQAAFWEYKVIRRLLKHPKILNKAISPINVPGNWFTNGKNNILGKYCPIGYWAGRTYIETENYKKLYQKQKQRKWYNNGSVSIHVDICPGSNWKKGRLSSETKNWNGKSLKGKLWWNNGSENLRGITPPDNSWVQGRLKFYHQAKRLPHSEERKKIQSEKIKGRKWYNNGVVEIMSHIPIDGYDAGRLLTVGKTISKTKQQHQQKF
jgi:hypothetical protein